MATSALSLLPNYNSELIITARDAHGSVMKVPFKGVRCLAEHLFIPRGLYQLGREQPTKGSEASERDVCANISFKEVILMSKINCHWEYFLSQLSR